MDVRKRGVFQQNQYPSLDPEPERITLFREPGPHASKRFSASVLHTMPLFRIDCELSLDVLSIRVTDGLSHPIGGFGISPQLALDNNKRDALMRNQDIN